LIKGKRRIFILISNGCVESATHRFGEIIMKKSLLALASLSMLAGAAMAQQSPWLVRARAVNLDMTNSDSTGLGLSVNNKTIPEFDISYFFTPNVAAELILTVPQKQTVHSTALSADAGTFKHLPPTLTLQYHFTDFQGFKPYVGAGFNYTKISSVHLDAATAGLGVPVTLDGKSTGFAYQVGVDFPIDKQWSINLDVKKVAIKTNVYANGVSAGTLKLDPLLYGVGIGYRF
jgi:outer membrane protein